MISGNINNGTMVSIVANPDLVFVDKNNPARLVRINSEIKLKNKLSLKTLIICLVDIEKIQISPRRTSSFPCQLGMKRGRLNELRKIIALTIFCLKVLNRN